jgi:hypothetical protein
MNLAVAPLVAVVLLCLLAPASHVQGEAPAEAAKPVRQRFVPAPPGAARGNNASFSAFHHLAVDDPGVSMLMAHAGVGESFPVQDERGPKLFEVLVAAGDDDLLKIELRRTNDVTTYDLKRDGTVWAEVAGEWFSISYPSRTVSSKDAQTSEQVMLIVNRFSKK